MPAACASAACTRSIMAPVASSLSGSEFSVRRGMGVPTAHMGVRGQLAVLARGRRGFGRGGHSVNSNHHKGSLHSAGVVCRHALFHIRIRTRSTRLLLAPTASGALPHKHAAVERPVPAAQQPPPTWVPKQQL